MKVEGRGMKRFLNKKGSSLVMVLGAMLILTAVGVLVITMSSANIRMSSKYRAWTEEYYDLDYAAQERLVAFDRQTLVPAELMARYYLQNNYLAYATIDEFPAGTPMADALKLSLADGKLQTILHNRQLEAAALLKVSPEPEGTPDPTASPGPDMDESQVLYNEAMEKLAEQAFKALYYHRVDQLVAQNATDTPQPSSGNAAILTLCDLAASDWFPDFTTLDGLISDVEDAMPQLAVTAYEPASMYAPEAQGLAKKVEVLVTLKSPLYELSPQSRYVPLKINPLYTNALSAWGSIRFTNGGSAVITGDVAVGNNGVNSGISENNDGGFITYNKSVTVYGNVYSAGDIHAAGTGGNVSIREYPVNYTNLLKEKLYGNDYYLEDTVYAGMASLDEEHLNGDLIPYLYKDSGGGNAYCNSLVAEPAAGGADLYVAGDLWTRDDIQNDASGASIRVNGNYIGLNSSAENGNPNGSSAVINNTVGSGGTIELGGDYVIPGTAFYIFRGNDYYQTAESGSARTIESFASYLALAAEPSETYNGEESGETYSMFDAANLNAQIVHFKKYFTDNDITPLSGIGVKNGSDYYTLGVVVNKDGTIYYSGGEQRSHNNYLKYSEASALMPGVLNVKSQYFGTNGRDIGNLVNPAFGVNDRGNGFYYFKGSTASFSVGGESGSINSGIVYCAANELIITGSGEFKGAIICNGNVTVQGGNVKLTYDEDVVLGVLGVSEGQVIHAGSGSLIARRFFSPAVPLTMGEDLGTEQIDTVSVSAGERTVNDAVDRYTINAWRESHVAAAPPS